MRSVPMRVKRQGALRLHPIGLLTIVVLVALCFAGGYHSGSSSSEIILRHALQNATRYDKELAQSLHLCHQRSEEHVKAIMTSSKELQTLASELHSLRHRMDMRGAEYRAKFDEGEKCEQEKAIWAARRAERRASDAQKMVEIEDLTSTIDELQDRLASLTQGGGMAAVYLSQRAASFRRSYVNHCNRFPGCVVLTEEELLAKWGTSLDAPAPVSADMGGDWGKIVFARTLDYTASYGEEPLWFFGRAAGEEPVNLTSAETDTHHLGAEPWSLPVGYYSTIAGLEQLLDYSLCAYRIQNANLTFPTLYIPPPDERNSVDASVSPQGYLHQLVRTPLVRFCVGCDASEWRHTFLAVCGGETATSRSNYGTADYWAVRRMQQPSVRTLRRVQHIYEANDLAQRGFLAVDATQRGLRCERIGTESSGRGRGMWGNWGAGGRGGLLQRMRAPSTVHADFLRARYPAYGSLAPPPGDVFSRCSPSAIQLLERVAQVLRQQLPTRVPAVVYVVTDSDEFGAELQSELRQRESLLAGVKLELVTTLLSHGNDGKGEKQVSELQGDETVAWEVAARAAVLLLNSFSPVSRRIQEGYLLHHNLTLEDKTIYYL